MRKIALLVLAFTLFSFACSEKSGDMDRPMPNYSGSLRRIAVIPKSTAHIFWKSVHAGARKAAQEHGVEIVWTGIATETDIKGQISILENCIDNKDVNAIVIAPCDEQALARFVEKAMESKPVIIFNSPVKTNMFTSFVATDNYHGGVLGAKEIGKLLGGKGKVAIIGVQPGEASTTKRENGFIDTIKKKFPAIELLPIKYGKNEVGESMKVTEAVLTANPDIKAIFASSESSTVGALRALKKGKKAKQIPIIGFDSNKELLEGLKTGEIKALVAQDPFNIGYMAISSAVFALNGMDIPEKRVKTDLRVITIKTLDTPEIQNIINPSLKPSLNIN